WRARAWAGPSARSWRCPEPPFCRRCSSGCGALRPARKSTSSRRRPPLLHECRRGGHALNVAVVARVDLRQAIVLDQAGREIAGRLRARFMDRSKRLRGALVAGDEVEWDVDAQGTSVVEEILPRRNLFRRRAAGQPP